MKNRVVLITGGTTGYGYAMVEKFVQNGDRVIATARHADKLAEVKKKVGCDVFKMDVTEPKEPTRCWISSRGFGLRLPPT